MYTHVCDTGYTQRKREMNQRIYSVVDSGENFLFFKMQQERFFSEYRENLCRINFKLF